MMRILEKMNIGDHREIHVIDAPGSFELELAWLEGVEVRRGVSSGGRVGFAIVFVRTLAEVEAAAGWLGRAEGDAVIWFAYPKGSSKRYRCEFNRDNGWAAVGSAGFEAVRMVAIDEDWSALRFRRVEYVKRLTRDPKRAVSREGKARAVASREAGGKPKSGGA